MARYINKELVRTDVNYPADCRRLVKIAFNNGVLITLKEAEDIWHDVSERSAAGWLILYREDNDVWNSMEPYVKQRIEND